MPVHQPKHARRSRRYVAVTTAAATAVTAAGLPFAVAYAATPAPLPGPPVPAGTQAARATLLPERHASKAVVLPGGYLVRRGDTLSAIAARFCGSAADYRALAVNNRIGDANLIFPGELVRIACRAALAALAPAAAPPDPRAALTAAADPPARVTAAGGTLGCTGLEALWDAAGGNQADAFMAAEIAMAESGGRQYALSPTDDRGYWQISWVHGALSTYNALGNARAAVEISDDGTDWEPWVTYQKGLYAGRC
jgi:hypothetical protein